MDLKQAGLFAAVVLGVAGTAETTAFAQSAPAVRQVNVSRLPIDIQRIQRQLRQAPSDREQREGLNLRYQIEVYGRAPEIKLFTREDNLTNGPVPYGAPTHQEFVDHLTPQEFRAPAMDFSALMKWLADKAK